MISVALLKLFNRIHSFAISMNRFIIAALVFIGGMETIKEETLHQRIRISYQLGVVIKCKEYQLGILLLPKTHLVKSRGNGNYSRGQCISLGFIPFL